MLDWQTALSLGIVALAAIVLGCRIHRWWSDPHQGKGCGSCPSKSVGSVKELPLVRIDTQRR